MTSTYHQASKPCPSQTCCYVTSSPRLGPMHVRSPVKTIKVAPDDCAPGILRQQELNNPAHEIWGRELILDPPVLWNNRPIGQCVEVFWSFQVRDAACMSLPQELTVGARACQTGHAFCVYMSPSQVPYHPSCRCWLTGDGGTGNDSGGAGFC